ncbi:MOSC domain-containing protein [Iamia sp. SCSIO 61187]|uniref:MOSC domain-containing protein n=1 Tax=Iamia sp. SCSIO 61187 TaxID=2722752 RepID=UPI002104BABC|nr:MOSC domain-containing protein [Iamia sp. SCSIO 61187]QYG95196.1 MOSC domain-containing protein [Iamia sp. SCSIO 61187]
MNQPPTGTVASVNVDGDHRFSKTPTAGARLLAGLGVEGDAHSGSTVRHRSRVRADPTQPNLRQVHLIGAEMFEALAAAGFAVGPGDLGENLTTSGIDLHDLPVGSVLRIGDGALVALTGLRNPCGQIEGFRTGLLDHVRSRDASGAVVRRAGVMGVVVHGGTVRAGDRIEVALPPGPHVPLERI